MYCSNCGSLADGRFCASCGTKVRAAAGAADAAPQPADAIVGIKPFSLLAREDVKERLLQASRRGKTGLDLDAIAKMGTLFAGSDADIPARSILEVVSAAYGQLGRIGIRTGKEATRRLRGTPADILVAAVCALVASGHEINRVERARDGFSLEGVIPPNLISWGGKLVVTLTFEGAGCSVKAAALISGQLFDWGRCRRILNAFFEEVDRELAVTSPN